MASPFLIRVALQRTVGIKDREAHRTLLPFAFCFLPFAFFFLLGCGYVGPVQPPALNIPAPVSDLSVVEQGDKLIVQFTIPKVASDGLALRNQGPVELRVGPNTALPFNIPEWQANSKLIENIPPRPGPAKAVIPAAQWIGQEIVAGVRLSSVKGRLSQWSNRPTLRLVPPLAAPAFQLEQVREGVRVSWQAQPASGISYRVYRSDTPVATLTANEWIDTTVKFGEAYRYTVQAFEKSGDIDAESEIPAAKEITPVPKFPPAVPAGLKAIAGTESIELEWDRNSEPDLKGYRVYRSANGGAWEKIAETEVPSYSDHAIKPGQQYQYAVSAIDQAALESPRSAPVAASTP